MVKSWVTVRKYIFLRSTRIRLFFATFSVMGKAEGHGINWHGHVTALTVSPDYRRLGLAATLMQFLEDVSEKYTTSVTQNDV